MVRVLVKPAAIDEQFRKAWMPFFCRRDKGSAEVGIFYGCCGRAYAYAE